MTEADHQRDRTTYEVDEVGGSSDGDRAAVMGKRDLEGDGSHATASIVTADNGGGSSLSDSHVADDDGCRSYGERGGNEGEVENGNREVGVSEEEAGGGEQVVADNGAPEDGLEGVDAVAVATSVSAGGPSSSVTATTVGGGDVDSRSAAAAAASGNPSIRTFYLVKVPRCDTNVGSPEEREAELKVRQKREALEYIRAALRLKQAARTEAYDNLRNARQRLRACGEELNMKGKERGPLVGALQKLEEVGQEARKKRREVPVKSEEELDQRIAELEHQIEHETISLQEEKKILREIKNLKSSRDDVRALVALQNKFDETRAQREALESQLKPIKSEGEVLKLEMGASRKIVEEFEAEAKVLEDSVKQLMLDRTKATEEHDAAFEHLRNLRHQAVTRDQEFYNNRRELQKVKYLASERDIKGLEEFCTEQVERRMEQWNNDTDFRRVYVKNNERSTIRRFGCLDGRSPGVDEEAFDLVDFEGPQVKTLGGGAAMSAVSGGQAGSRGSGGGTALAKSGATTASGGAKGGLTAKKEELPKANGVGGGGSKKESGGGKKVGKGGAPGVAAKETGDQVASKRGGGGAEEFDAFTTAPANGGFKVEEVEEDPAIREALREKRRKEEMEKAKEAEERKRRLTERAEARARARKVKEEEELAKKKEKERLKRARKRAAAAAAAGQVDGDEVKAEEEAGDTAAVGEETGPVVSRGLGGKGSELATVSTASGNAYAGRSKKSTPDAARRELLQKKRELMLRAKDAAAAAARKGNDNQHMWMIIAIVVAGLAIVAGLVLLANKSQTATTSS